MVTWSALGGGRTPVFTSSPWLPALLAQLEYRTRYGGAGQLRVPEAVDVAAMLKAATTPTIRGEDSILAGPCLLPAQSRLPRSAAALASGPLALGFAGLKGSPPGKGGATPARCSSGNPFADGGVASYNVHMNPAASFETAPSGELHGSSAGGRIPAYVPAPADSAPPPPAAALPGDSDTVVLASGAWGSRSVEALPVAASPAAAEAAATPPQHARSGTVVVVGEAPPAVEAPAAVAAASQQSADYAAALGVGAAASEGGGSAKAVRKQVRVQWLIQSASARIPIHKRGLSRTDSSGCLSAWRRVRVPARRSAWRR